MEAGGLNPNFPSAVPSTHKENKSWVFFFFLEHLKEQGAVLLCHHRVCFPLNKEILFYHRNNPKMLQGWSEEFM